MGLRVKEVREVLNRTEVLYVEGWDVIVRDGSLLTLLKSGRVKMSSKES